REARPPRRQVRDPAPGREDGLRPSPGAALMPRRWPTWLLLGLGLLSLFWGLYRLERIFVDEREEAHAQVTEEQNTLAEYARRTLEQHLEQALHDAEESLPAARSDPLVAAQGLLLVEDGRQLLPRRDAPRDGDDAPGQ